MDFKYKIADVAKEFGMPAKKVVETVSGVTGEANKTVGTFEENYAATVSAARPLSSAILSQISRT